MIDRRILLKAGLGLGTVLLPQTLWANPVFAADPFSLGIASGDPASDGFVIWTRLAPRPLEPDGGMPRGAVEVKWQIASDEGMKSVLRTGQALARSELAHSVHVEIAGLEPGRDYFFRFEAGGVRSPVGRSKTLQNPGGQEPVRFASAGCQWYEEGHFTAWRRIAEERPDFVIHYGDYIYEYAARKPGGRRQVPIIRDMPGAPGKVRSLAEYRNRYAIYKLDADLQAAHAATPFVMSFDDHEIENNWAGLNSAEEKIDAAGFLKRRAAAFQAWYEHMPLRLPQRPVGGDIRAYRRIMVGNLLEINVLDTRQYRSIQPCDDGWKICPEAKGENRTMLGKAQESWLTAGFKANRPAWTVLANQVPIARFDRNPDPAITETDMDKWDGVEAARARLFRALGEAGRHDVIALSGDVHQNRACDLKLDFDDPASKAIGAEFTATSISSGGNGRDRPAAHAALERANPHLKFINNQRGFVRHTVSRARWQADFAVLDTVSAPGGKLSARASFVVEAGRPGLKPA